MSPVALGSKAAGVRFQAAVAAYHSGDYSLARPEFEKLAQRFRQAGNLEGYVECAIYILRLLAESEELVRIKTFDDEVRAMLPEAKSRQSALLPQLRSRIEYVLGIAFVYRGGHHEEAMNCFYSSIRAAMEADDRATLAWPLYGAATVLYARERYDDALKELAKLLTLLECRPNHELTSSTLLLKTLVHRNLGQFDLAYATAWQAFESLRYRPHLSLYLHTLTALATVLIARNSKADRGQAKLYLELANRSLRRDQFTRLARIVDAALISLQGHEESKVETATERDFDLRFDINTGSLIEAKKGEIEFEGQFILRDLLLRFLQTSLKSPGKTIRKEELIRDVWGESYHPDTHDNKIYVNIKRLRQLIEAKDGSTEYIKRGKQGYYLNPKTRVLLVDSSATQDSVR